MYVKFAAVILPEQFAEKRYCLCPQALPCVVGSACI